MRRVLSLTTGAPGRLVVSAACLATVVVTAAGHFAELVASAGVLVIWSTIFAVALMALTVAASMAGVYDEGGKPHA